MAEEKTGLFLDLVRPGTILYLVLTVFFMVFLR